MMGSLYQLNPHCFLSLSPSLVCQQIPAPLSFAPQLLSQQRLAALLSTQSLSPHLAPWVNSHPSQERSSPRLEGSTSLLQLCHKHLTRLPAWPSDQPNSPDKQDMNITNAMMRLGLCYWAESQRKHSLSKKTTDFLLCCCAPVLHGGKQWSLSCPPSCSEQGVPVDNVVQVHCNNEPGFLCITGTTGALVLKNVHSVGNFQEEERKLLKEIEFICYLHNYITQNRIWWYFVEGSGEKGEGIL